MSNRLQAPGGTAERRLSRVSDSDEGTGGGGGGGGVGGGLSLLTAPHRRMSRISDVAIAQLAARRISQARRASVASLRSTDNSSQKPPVKLQNTYKVGPNEDEKFNRCTVQNKLANILESFLAGEKYDEKKSPIMARNLTEVIRGRMRELAFPRYKIVVNVMIGHNNGQGMNCSSKFLWDDKNDNFATATYKGGNLFAIASVYGLFFE